MDLSDAVTFAAARHHGVLATLKRDGRPQLSNISYGFGDDGVIRISITADRAKYTNLGRDPRASLYVTRDDFYGYVVLEAVADLAAVASDPHDATVDELVLLYKQIAGEHSDWDEYRTAMVRDRRLTVRLRPFRGYGMLGG